MKLMKKLVLFGATAALLMSQLVLAPSAATPETKEWLDPFNNASFPMAKKLNVKYPSYYETEPGADHIFSPNGDAKALAAVKTNKTVRLFERIRGSFDRTDTLMKDYVGATLEIIYEFKNGFKDFEFMGVCGQPGIWAGMFGKENTIEFAYADKESGPWTTYDYMEIRDIANADATKAYFSSDDVPITARYLRITFLEGNDENAPQPDNDKPKYPNWQCGLGYLYVNEYVTAPTATTSDTASTAPTNSSKPTTATSSRGTGNSTSQPAASSNESTTNSDAVSSVVSESTVSNESTITETPGNDEDNTPDNTTGNESAAVQYQTVTRVNWPAVIGTIIAAVVVIGAGVAGLLIYLKKKHNH